MPAPVPVQPAPVENPADAVDPATGLPADSNPASTGETGASGETGVDSSAPSMGPASETQGALAEVPPPPPPSLIDFQSDVVVAEGEETFVLANWRARAEFTNLGAQLVSFKLLSDLNKAGEPTEMVRPRGVDPHPFALLDGDLSHRLNKALWVVTEEEDADGHPSLRFRHRSERGSAEKVFSWTAEDLLKVEVTVEGTPRWGLLMGPGVRALDEGEEMKVSAMSGIPGRKLVYRENDDMETIQPKKVDEDMMLSPAVDWVGLEDNYFLNAALPSSGLANVVIRPVQQRRAVIPEEPRFLPVGAKAKDEVDPEVMILLQASGPQMELQTFFGSKEYRRLSAMPYGLEETIHWGAFIGVLARPLYYCVDYIYKEIVPNYGWAIVLTTILIRLVFLPLTFKGQMSMTKMQELNPKVQAIRAKYRNKLKDKQGRPNVEAQQELNKEIMGLYKKAGVNPMGGCFPILLQMPVFFAFFRLLSTSVELRGAPWIGWITDLSASDPYLVLPILMGVTSILMQKQMPQSPDPMQRRVMQIMPIMFTIFALAFPAGLVVYWITNNILSIGQQALMLKFKKRQEASRAEATA